MDFFSVELPGIPVVVTALAIGALVCFFGYRLFKVVLGLTGFAAGAVAGAGFATLLTSGTQTIVLVFAVIGGVIGAVILVWAYYVGMFVVGAAGGALIGGLVAAGFAAWLQALIIVALAVVGGVLALKLQRIVLGVSTGIVGAAAIVAAGLNAVLGADAAGALAERIASGGAFGEAGWIGLGCWIVVSAAGVSVQLSSKHRKKKKGG